MILKVAKRLAIRNYLKRSWSLLPIEPEGKAVLDVLIPADETSPLPDGDWKQFTRRRAPESQILGWLEKRPAMNLAVVTGAISGVLVLDIDDPAHLDPDLKPWLVTCQQVPRVRTARGYHLYFKHPAVKLSNANKPFTGMDIRCDDGYAILPPSVGATGHTYTWEVPLGDELPPLPFGLVDLLVRLCGPYQAEAVHDGASDEWMFDYPDDEEGDEYDFDDDFDDEDDWFEDEIDDEDLDDLFDDIVENDESSNKDTDVSDNRQSRNRF